MKKSDGVDVIIAVALLVLACFICHKDAHGQTWIKSWNDSTTNPSQVWVTPALSKKLDSWYFRARTHRHEEAGCVPIVWQDKGTYFLGDKVYPAIHVVRADALSIQYECPTVKGVVMADFHVHWDKNALQCEPSAQDVDPGNFGLFAVYIIVCGTGPENLISYDVRWRPRKPEPPEIYEMHPWRDLLNPVRNP